MPFLGAFNERRIALITFYPVKFFDEELGVHSVDLAQYLGVKHHYILKKIKSIPMEYSDSNLFKIYTDKKKGIGKKKKNYIYLNKFAVMMVLLHTSTDISRRELFKLIVSDHLDWKYLH